MLGPIALFGINPMELLIVGAVALVVLGGPVIALVILYFALRKKPMPSNPNLTPCPDCGRLVSHLAASCPQCGRPMNPTPANG